MIGDYAYAGILTGLSLWLSWMLGVTFWDALFKAGVSLSFGLCAGFLAGWWKGRRQRAA